jgi:hypothetical protein
MTVTSLDAIVRNMLLKQRYGLCYYLDFLLYAAECLKELTLDDLQIVNTKLLTVSDTGTIELPNDYVDYVSVCLRVGQHLRPLVEDNSLNPMPNYDSDFVAQPYYNYTGANNGYFNQVLYPYIYNTVNYNTYGEFIGRMYGWAGGNGADTFKVIKERNVIQINQRVGDCKAVLSYIPSGQSADAATHVDLYADATIKAYINWQRMENSRTYSTSDKERGRQLYINERKILRARLSDLTLTKMKRILTKNALGSPK